MSLGSSTLCSKNYLLCYSPMLPNVAYYAIDSHPLFHIMLEKFSEIHYTTQISSFRVHSSSSVHRPFSTTVQQITRDVTLAVSTIRECDCHPLWPLVPLLLAKSLLSPPVAIFFSAHSLGVKVMSHMTYINITVLTYYAGIIPQCYR